MSRHNFFFHLHLSRKYQLSLFDKIAMVAAVLYPLSTVPQVISVFQGSVAGISIYTWTGYVFFAALFLFYGIVHKIKLMIITNALWLAVDILVVAGLLI